MNTTMHLSFATVICSLLLVVLGFSACTPLRRTKNIVYSRENNLTLNVFAPRNTTQPEEVLLFVHGGSWIHGKKSTYNFLGRGMARKGMVTVIIDYRLSPAADYKGMAADVAMALKWTKENISSYGGDPGKIYISGHSAGGQLAALVATDNSYCSALGIQNPVKGAVMIDAFGLDMYHYFNTTPAAPPGYYLVFGRDSAAWKSASPAYHLHRGMPPFLLFAGGKTYAAIKTGTAAFYAALKPYQPSVQLIEVPHSRHIGMIFSFLNPRKKAYRQIIGFMKGKGAYD